MIVRLDNSQMAELYLIREVLEATAARLAAAHASDAEIAVLADMVQMDRTLIEAPQELAIRNRAFHRQLQLCGRNRYLNRISENMRLSFVLLGGTTLAMPQRVLQSIEEHAALVAAIAKHNPDEAEECARAHIRNAFRARLGPATTPSRE